MDPSKEFQQLGYHRLAALMSGDKNLAIFRRFDDLDILCLLSLQADIMKLRRDFYFTSHLDNTMGSADEKLFSASLHASREKNSRQYQLLEEIREKLEKYNGLLLQLSQLNDLHPPRRRQLEYLQHWLGDPKGGNNFQHGVEMTTWLGEAQSDPALYVAPKPGLAETDIFTSSALDFISGPFHRHIGQKLGMGRVIDEDSDYVSYEDSKISRFSSIVVTIIAAMLPPLAILALNSVRTTNQRIGLTVAFTAIFAGILACFSGARRVDILVATATFAAVEVVFIGSAVSSPGQSSLKGNLTLLGAADGPVPLRVDLTAIDG